MNGLVRSISSVERVPLKAGWEIAGTTPNAIGGYDAALLGDLHWISASARGTVAAILRAAGRWDFTATERFDARDWWYRLRFSTPGPGPTILGFDGLATVAEVWLNGAALLSSDNMFVAHAIRTLLRPGENELVLRFKALDTLLQGRRPRPRWRAPMVENQQLRWFRTTLLGRTPGWSPPAAAVGPWRPIWIESDAPVSLEAPQLQAELVGAAGIVRAHGLLKLGHGARLQAAALIVARGAGSQRAEVKVESLADGSPLHAELQLPEVERWWPHTHGEPALYAVRLELQLAGTAAPITLALGHIGFRTLEVDTAGGNFVVRVNGERIFCRGACWTPPDVVALETAPAAAAGVLDQVVAAGMNMIRVGGTMVYESDAFLDACDARGVLLWQDFMFANMDYPEADAAFRTSVTNEVRQLLERLGGRPCLAVLCGNSEGEQQAAMWGAPRERWSHPLFHELLPQLCAAHASGTAYWPSSAHGGAFPHQGNVGTTSYYGVGAYLRPLDDARRAQIRFATECLAFANVPEEPLLLQLAAAGGGKVHSPLWKSRVPRDLGAGWDFDDVRDHYLREVFDLDPPTVRYAEHDRYLEYGRATSAEVMAAAFREWRRGCSDCNGALIWFLRDLWPGAGWGVIDSSGEPKSGYYGLARLLQPRTVFITDEGGNGLYAHVLNETGGELAGTLALTLIPASGRSTLHRIPVTVGARGTLELPLVAMLEGFSDLSYSYRFGPPPYEAVRIALLDAAGAELAHDFHFLLGHRRLAVHDPGLAASAQRLPDGNLSVQVSSERLARFVSLRVPGFRAADQYFHLAPETSRTILLRALESHPEPAGEVLALNAAVARRITVSP